MRKKIKNRVLLKVYKYKKSKYDVKYFFKKNLVYDKKYIYSSIFNC